MQSLESRQWVSGAILMGAADATKVLVAGQPGRIFNVTGWLLSSVIAAAQAFDLESTDGAVELEKIAATWAVGSRVQSFDLWKGIALPVGTGLRLQPAAAGPSVLAIFEGYFTGV